MTAMKSILLASFLPVASFLLVAGTCSAAAAVVKADGVGCRHEADLKRRLPTAATDGGKIPVNAAKIAVEPDKIRSGECAPFHRGVSVSIDEKKGDLVCVRPYGGLDCFWTPTTMIDDHPPSSPAEQHHRSIMPLLNNGFRPGVRTSF
jgi:hypothetical protein